MRPGRFILGRRPLLGHLLLKCLQPEAQGVRHSIIVRAHIAAKFICAPDPQFGGRVLRTNCPDAAILTDAGALARARLRLLLGEDLGGRPLVGRGHPVRFRLGAGGRSLGDAGLPHPHLLGLLVHLPAALLHGDLGRLYIEFIYLYIYIYIYIHLILSCTCIYVYIYIYICCTVVVSIKS
jgi:hypothetical protein